MQIDWRALLSSIHIEWRDRGANCTRGNVNVACPWCHNDPSFHLGIAEGKEAYYCYRAPNQHSGRSFVSLLIRLGNSREEAVALLNRHMRSELPEAPEHNRKADLPSIVRAWSRFAPATMSTECRRYLHTREIAGPFNIERVVAEYDLRWAQEGTWARRILLPYRGARGDLITWTGRALRPESHLRYMTQPVANENGLIYVPNYNLRDKSILVLVEGPFDALKLAVNLKQTPYIPVALTGLQLNASKLLRLRPFAEHCDRVLVALDAEVTANACYQIISELAVAMKSRYIGRAKLPVGVKDPAELQAGDILQWLNESNSSLK